MADAPVALELARFLDSAAARALPAPSPKDVRAIAERFLAACYGALGKKPRLLDGQELHELIGHVLPGRFGSKDPLASHVGVVLAAYFDHLEQVEMVPNAFELRQALHSTVPEFEAAVRSGAVLHHHGPPPKPFVHGARKLGRNDPCSCGSGKKFKKCHGGTSGSDA